MDNTFITLHRKIIQSACFDDAELLKVWLWCLLRANYKDREVIHAGQVIQLHRGEFITGRFSATKELNMTAAKFRARIALLEKMGQISQKTTNKYSVIHVEKYNDYQTKEKEITNKKPTKNQQKTTDNNINNINKQQVDLFNDFWREYPKKVGKAKAEQTWKKIDADPLVVIKALAKHKKTAQWTKDGGQFIPNPATWLNQKRWEDEVDVTNRPITQLDASAEIKL